MTVPAQSELFNSSTANGVTTSFPYTFMILSADDIVVMKDGVIQTSGFSITGVGSTSGGAVVFSVAPANGVIVNRYLDVSLERATDYQQFGDWTADAVNADMDRIILGMQSLDRKIERAIKLPSNTAGDQTIYETAAERAGTVVGFDTNGDMALLPGLAGSSLVDLAASSGSSLIGHIGSGTGAAATTVQAKLREIVSVTDFSTAALADANGGSALFVPSNVTSTIANGAALTALYNGPGRLTTADSNKRGKYFGNATAAPASTGTHTSIDTAFNGDLSKSHFQVEHRITGAATAGQPTTGYTYTPEIFPHYTYLYNTSGYNHATDTNTGRTGIAAHRVKVYHNGQGDAVAFNASVFVTGARAGATSFLANPAGVLFNGDMTAGQAGVYLNPRETVLDDGGFDVAGIGDVVRLTRSVDTGALDAWWAGYRVQSDGSKEIDVAFSAIGKANIGLDFTFLTLPSSGVHEQAAVTLKAGQRIYFNADGVDSSGLMRYPSDALNTYMRYDSGTGAMQCVVGGASSLQVYSNQVIANNVFRHMNFDLGFFAATPTTKQAVAGSRGGNAALASLITALSNYGLVTDSSTA